MHTCVDAYSIEVRLNWSIHKIYLYIYIGLITNRMNIYNIYRLATQLIIHSFRGAFIQ